jgi:SAM-dependent methyltransferase
VELDAAAVRPGVERGAGKLGPVVDDNSPGKRPPGSQAVEDAGHPEAGQPVVELDREAFPARVVDADPAHVTMAKQFAAEHELRNVEVVAADARHTGLPSGSFDVVHTRTLLVTIPEPATVVREMVRLARPGGWVVSLEPDTEYGLCYPAHPAFARLGALFDAVFRRNGADPFIGRRLTELYRDAELHDIGVEMQAPIHPPGHTRRTIRLDLVRSMRPMILESGLAEERELDELDRTAREHLANPNTLVMPSLYFLAWGRRPTSLPDLHELHTS